MLAVMIVGIVLVIFGAVVLLMFPNRPGGKIAYGGIEISSMGAGLPLIVLGVGCILISSTGVPDLDFLNNQNSNATTSIDAKDCFKEYFRGIPEDRVATLEAGAENVQLIGPHQSKDEAIAIKFTENNQPIGAIKFYFFSNNDMFKVETVVDSKCRQIEQYKNAARGGDKRVLQNWDSLEIKFGDYTYALRLGYEGGKIDALHFRRVSP